MDKAIINHVGQSIEVDLDERLWTYKFDEVEYAVMYMPGLNELIIISVQHGLGPCWTFDGNKNNPTLSPSLLSSYKYGEPQREICNHVFIRNGMIEYLQDCTHDLAGKTIELPRLRDWPECYQYWLNSEE